jgi:hypothetical protein
MRSDPGVPRRQTAALRRAIQRIVEAIAQASDD